MRILTITQREIKLGLRNSWTYSFLILLSVFASALFILQSGIETSAGYTDITGTMLNMILYLLPLITLLLGGFSITAEKEEGHWSLLSTYPLSTYRFLWGKWLGIAVILVTMLLFSFGIAGLIAALFGEPLAIGTLTFFWLFSVALSLIYLSVAVLIGAFAKNRWQALISAVGIWFLTVAIWPLLIISTLSQLPSYKMVQPALEMLTILNPAEFVRVFFIMRLGAGAVFGASYDAWITWATGGLGLVIFTLVFSVWIIVAIYLGGFIWMRGARRD